MKKQKRNSKIRQWLVLTGCCLIGVVYPGGTDPVEASMLGGPSHIGTFEGSTTFTTSSSNGINPGLYLEVMDEYGNYTEYTSEEGVITIPGTQEGAYVTQAKFLGKTKYVDQDTGEVLDEWEAGRSLTLESVEGPSLTITGKNLATVSSVRLEGIKGNSGGHSKNIIMKNIPVEEGKTYTISGIGTKSENMNYILFTRYEHQTPTNSNNHTELWNEIGRDNADTTFTIPKGINYISFTFGNCVYNNNGEDGWLQWDNIQLEEGSAATSYEPYQSNVLTVKEDVTLRGIDEVRDTLDLITGEIVGNVDEIVFEGNEAWKLWDNNPGDVVSAYVYSNEVGVDNVKAFAPTVNNVLPNNSGGHIATIEGFRYTNYFTFSIHKNKIGATDVNDTNTNAPLLKQWLSANHITVQYQLEKPAVETVTLNSTYHFKPVKARAVYVDGTVVPLVCSVTVPTQPLSFVLNPNEEPGKQFIAPEFTIENNNPASLSVSLKEFKQVTTVFNDVLPSQHADWSQLDQEQSKDLALALVPKVSDGWKQLKEGPRYVVDSTNDEIGEIKPKSSVDFTFSASHGPAFTQALSPRYRLVFVFDF